MRADMMYDGGLVVRDLACVNTKLLYYTGSMELCYDSYIEYAFEWILYVDYYMSHLAQHLQLIADI